jgi:hypothetical protein
MRSLGMVCFLVVTVTWAQVNAAVPSATPTGSPAGDPQTNTENTPSSASSPASDVPVLTIKDLCEQSQPKSEARDTNPTCATVITRAQFERLVDALQPDMGPETKRRLATAYPQFLIMAHEAEKRGLDKQPRIREKLAFARLQILSQELVRQIQEQAAEVPEKDIENYYQKHSGDFEQARLERIVVPNRRQAKNQQTGKKGNESEDAMTSEAETLRALAAAGGDFAKLQEQAYGAAGVGGASSPNPSLGNLRRRGLPPAHASVFDLKPGQVSQVLSDATGHYIYKLESKEIQPLDAVNREISNILRQQRAETTIRNVEEPFTTDVNKAYFSSETNMDNDAPD